MWNRRDVMTLACAAAATFGLTVATFWPRTANAVDESKAAIANVKVPTLNLDNVQVTAMLDSSKEHTVLLTARNTTNEAATATFTAAAMVQSAAPTFSRVGPMSQQVWSQEFVLQLKAGETQTVAVELPVAAFNMPQSPAPPLMTPGRSYLQLTGQGGGRNMRIMALALATPAAPEAQANGTVTPAVQGILVNGQQLKSSTP